MSNLLLKGLASVLENALEEQEVGQTLKFISGKFLIDHHRI